MSKMGALVQIFTYDEHSILQHIYINRGMLNLIRGFELVLVHWGDKYLDNTGMKRILKFNRKILIAAMSQDMSLKHELCLWFGHKRKNI